MVYVTSASCLTAAIVKLVKIWSNLVGVVELSSVVLIEGKIVLYGCYIFIRERVLVQLSYHHTYRYRIHYRIIILTIIINY